MKDCWEFRLTIRRKCTEGLDIFLKFFFLSIQIIYSPLIGLSSILLIVVSRFNSSLLARQIVMLMD